MQSLVLPGLPPDESRKDAVGRSKTGLVAELVLLDGNPISDISNTQKISEVVAHWAIPQPSQVRYNVRGRGRYHGIVVF